MNKALIMTQEIGFNMGGIIQAYALQKILLYANITTETANSKIQIRTSKIIISDFTRKFIGRFIGKSTINIKDLSNANYITANTQLFVQKHINTIDIYQGEINISELFMNKPYCAVIVGSDQVWRKPYSNIPEYMLEFTNDMDIKRISYAASFGKDDLSEYGDKLIKKTSMLAKKFDAISVREDSGVDICREYWGVDAVQHVDPTLLLEKDDYLKLIQVDINVLKKSDGKIFTYVLDYDKNKIKIIDQIASHLKMKTFDIMPPKPMTKKELRSNPDKFALPHVTQWLKSFKDADFVITDSFHGTVFSIIFNKPFIAIGNKERGLTRFSSLLRLFNLEERLVSNSDSVLSIVDSPINWKEVNEIKLREKKRGIEYLKDNLELAATTKGDI